MIKTIIFDFDGVILDSVNVKTNAFAKMFEEYGDEIVKKVASHHLANGGISRFEKFRYYYKEFLDRNINEEELKLLGKRFSKLVYEGVINSPYIPGAIEFLEMHKHNNVYFIASGTPENEILQIIEQRKLSQFFKKVYGSPKLKEEIIELIIEENNCRREEVLFIGDALTDYNAAKKTNTKFIGIRSDSVHFPDNAATYNNFNEIEKVWHLIE